MNDVAENIISKLWNLCNILKDDGITYHQYVIELTYLLFLKMAKETGTESQISEGHRWDDLKSKNQLDDRLELYKISLIHLATHGTGSIKEIFSNANSLIKKPVTLKLLIEGIDRIKWYNTTREDLGNIYEGLLEKNASEKKAGAGQYFTARPLIDSIISVMKPCVEDIIQDPAVGTGGFLIASNKFILDHDNKALWNTVKLKKYMTNTFYGMEHVQDTYRLALMNLLLHEIPSDPASAGIHYGDTLSKDGQSLPEATLILSNPPFGSKKGGGLPERTDLPFPTSNKQLCFLQHIYLSLKPGGRAAVIIPDNVLFEGNIGKQIRVDLMDRCNLHTILRLPTGIFYAQSVKTCVLFFTKGLLGKDCTKGVWVYDMRANTQQYGKRNTLSKSDFIEFEQAFGDDSYGSTKGLSKRKDTGETGRFRWFSRSWISAKEDNLDISWIKSEGEETQSDPIAIARDIMSEFESAIGDLQQILQELGEEVEG